MCEMDEYAIILSRHRYGQADEDLETARILLDKDKCRAANNRAYYAIFHCLRAVLALDKYDSSKHSGIISEFRKKYMKEHILPIEISKIIDRAFDIRNDSDYEDEFVADRGETIQQIKDAEYVLNTIGEYLRGKGVL